MRIIFLSCLLLFISHEVLTGADGENVPSFRRSIEAERDWSPYLKPVAVAEDWGKALQERWNTARIVAFMQLNRPNLIMGNISQKGELLQGKWLVESKGQEPIQVSWYVDQGKITAYRVIFTQGKNVWEAESSLLEDLKRPPYLIIVGR